MTWFKVDDDFFAHRKVVGLSDAAVALWTRAGSWSARNLTDGFVPTSALAMLTRAPQQAPAELIDRGLWRRARGGFQFHDWAEYQRSREDVLTERERWRQKKTVQRRSTVTKSNKSTSDTVLSPGDTTGDSRGNPTGVPDLSQPPRSYSRSLNGGPVEGVVTEVDARDREPPARCPQHIGQPADGPCGACGDTRRARETWLARKAEQANRRRLTALEQQAQAKAIAIADCDLCDDNGYAGNVLCDHDPDAVGRAARGMAKARAALAKGSPS